MPGQKKIFFEQYDEEDLQVYLEERGINAIWPSRIPISNPKVANDQYRHDVHTLLSTFALGCGLGVPAEKQEPIITLINQLRVLNIDEIAKALRDLDLHPTASNLRKSLGRLYSEPARQKKRINNLLQQCGQEQEWPDETGILKKDDTLGVPPPHFPDD